MNQTKYRHFCYQRYFLIYFLKQRNFKYGDGYCQVLSEGVKLLPNIQLFNLSGNRITNKGADTLLGNLSKNVKILDLSANAIGRLGIEHLYKILTKREYR